MQGVQLVGSSVMTCSRASGMPKASRVKDEDEIPGCAIDRRSTGSAAPTWGLVLRGRRDMFLNRQMRQEAGDVAFGARETRCTAESQLM